MTSEVQAKIVELVESAKQEIKNLSVTWFGGEPLLRPDIIEGLSFPMKDALKGTDVRFSAEVLTNGYCMTQDTVNVLKTAGVRRAQVTLDGGRETHDSRRCLSDGCGTYDTILENLGYASEHFDVVVRVNVDAELQSNPSAIEELVEDVKKSTGGRAGVYLSPIVPYSDIPGSTSRGVVSWREFSEAFLDLQQHLTAKGLSLGANKLRRIPMSCGALCDQTFTIGPNGDLFKCWEEPTMSGERIGNLLREECSVDEVCNVMRYRDHSIANRDECLRCAHLPECMGGCPRDSMATSRIDGRKRTCERMAHYSAALCRYNYLSAKSGTPPA